MSSIEINFIKVIDNYILIQIFPLDFKPEISNLIINHEYDLENNYSFQQVDTDKNYYQITFKKNINIYDSIKIYILKDAIISNTIYISMCKPVINESIILPLIHKNLPSGKYSLYLSSINEFPIEKIKAEFTFCNGINFKSSYVTTSSNSYSTSEKIDLDINLFDNITLSVPDAKYIIKVKVKNK